MTVATTTRDGEYVSDGSLTPRTINFPFLDPADIVVTVNDAARTMNVHYEISGQFPSASIVPLSGFATNGQTVRYWRETPPLQDYDISGSEIRAVALETSLDRLALTVQDEGSRIDRLVPELERQNAEALAHITEVVEAQAAIATAQATIATDAAALATAKANLAIRVAGISRPPLASYAALYAAIGSIGLGEEVVVLIDETHQNETTFYRKDAPTVLTYVGSTGRSVGRSSSEYFLRDFKIPSDTNYSNAFVRFCLGTNLAGTSGARADSSAGRAVKLNLPTDEMIYFDEQTTFACFGGIKNLHVVGYGAKLTNTSSGYASPMGFFGRNLITDSTKQRLIMTVRAGADTVSLRYSSQSTSIFSVGEWVLVAGFDIQFYGYPPNAQYFEYKKIKALTSTTITFEEGLRYGYRQDWPASQQGLAGYPTLGPAVVCKLDTVWGGDGRLCAAGNPTFPWDINVVLEGFEVTLPPNATSLQAYITTIGRCYLWRECSIPGTSESLTQSHIYEGGRITDISEPDKLNEYSLYDHVDIPKGLVFQSASQEMVEIRGRRLGYLSLGQAKNARVSNAILGSMKDGLGGPYGRAKNHVYDNVICNERTVDTRWEDSVVAGRGLVIDGTIVTYAYGVIAMPIASYYAFGVFNPVEGEIVALADSGGNYGRKYQGVILSVYTDSSYYYAVTSIDANTLPSGYTNLLRFSGAKISVRDSGGCAALVTASEACQKGYKPGLYHKFSFGGFQSVTNGSWKAGRGVLKELRINVTKATVGASTPRLVISAFTQDPDNIPGGGVTQVTYTIDTAVVGERVLTLSGITGAKTNDTFVSNGSAVTALPDRWYNGLNWAITGYTPSISNARQNPRIDITAIYDNGLVGSDLGQIVDDTFVNINAASVSGTTMTVTGSISGTRGNIIVGDNLSGPGLYADTIVTAVSGSTITYAPAAAYTASGAYVAGG